MEAEPLAVAEEEPAVQEVKLSKKALKGMEKKAAEAAAAAAAEGDDAETAEDLAAAGLTRVDARMTRRVASFDDKPAGFAYLKLDNGQLRFRNQEVRRGDAPRT